MNLQQRIGLIGFILFLGLSISSTFRSDATLGLVSAIFMFLMSGFAMIFIEGGK